MLEFLAVCIAGGVGAALRYVFDGTIRHHRRSSFPWATMIINLTGSLALGLVTGLAVALALPHHWQLILGTGLLGGYTTFSTASVETVRLLEEGRGWSAALNGLGMLLAGVAAATLGFVAGISFAS